MIEMIEINEHFVDTQKISYISPIRESSGGYWISEERHHDWCTFNFSIVVDTELVLLEFEDKASAEVARAECILRAR